MGYSLFYQQGENFSAEVTVYNLGRGASPDGRSGAGIDLVIESVAGGLKQLQGQEKIYSVRKKAITEIPKKGNIRFSNVVFQYIQPRLVEGRTNRISRVKSVYVTGSHENFIKLDFTFDKLEGKKAVAQSQQMLIQLIGLLKAQPTEDELLMAACDALVFDPAGYGGRTAAQRILMKTQELDNLNVYTHLFVWPTGYSKPPTADLLVAAYFAGMLKVVVPQQLDEGGEYEGFLYLLKAYEAMREHQQIESIAQLDEWVQTTDKKALFNHLLIDR